MPIDCPYRCVVLIKPAKEGRPVEPDGQSSSDAPVAPTAPDSGRYEPWWRVVQLYGPVLLIVVLSAMSIRRNTMFETEEASLWAGHLSIHKLFHLLSKVDAVHGTYYLMLHVLFRIFGTSPLVMRLPAVVGGALAVYVVNVLTRRLTGSRGTAAIAALLTALAPYVLFWASSGRSYGLDAGLALLGTLVFVWAVQPDGRRPPVWLRWVVYAVVVVFAGYMHEMTTLALAAHFVTLLCIRARRRVILQWLAAAVASALALIPLVIISSQEKSQLAWVQEPGMAKIRLLLTQFYGPEPVSIALLLLLIVVGIVYRMPAAEPGRRLTLHTVALPLFLVPPVLLFIESQISTPLFGGNHYILYCLPASLMLAAAGITKIAAVAGQRDVRLRAVSVVVLLAAVAASEAVPLNRLRGGTGYLQDVGPLARYVGAHARPGDLAVYLPAGYEYTPLGYPADFRDVKDAAAKVGPNRAALYRGIKMTHAQEIHNLLAHRRVWAIGLLHETTYVGRHRIELRTLTRHFRLVSEHHWHYAQVELFVRVHHRAPSVP